MAGLRSAIRPPYVIAFVFRACDTLICRIYCKVTGVQSIWNSSHTVLQLHKFVMSRPHTTHSICTQRQFSKLWWINTFIYHFIDFISRVQLFFMWNFACECKSWEFNRFKHKMYTFFIKYNVFILFKIKLNFSKRANIFGVKNLFILNLILMTMITNTYVLNKCW